MVAFLAAASGRAPDTVSFDGGAQLAALGATAVVFGPGDITVAHQTGEYVPLEELTRAAQILRRRCCTSASESQYAGSRATCSDIHSHLSDFLALPETDRRELIDGRFMEIDVPTHLHEHIVAMVIYFLMGWRKSGGGGHVLSSGYKIRIRDDQGFMPDVQYFKSGRVVPEQALSEGGPDLAVEVVSPSSARFDQVVKLNGYASIGTAEYWLIHPENRTLHRYVLGPTRHFVVEDALEGEVVFRPGTFPGLEIPLSELWTLPQ